MFFTLYIFSLCCFASFSGSPISQTKHKNRPHLSKNTALERNSTKLKHKGPEPLGALYEEQTNTQFTVRNLRNSTELVKTTPWDRRFYSILTEQAAGQSASVSAENIDSKEGQLNDNSCNQEEKPEQAFVREFSLQVKGVMRKYISSPNKVYDNKEYKPKIKFIAVPRAENGNNGKQSNKKLGLQRINLHSQQRKRKATTIRVRSTEKASTDSIPTDISEKNKPNNTDPKVGDMLWNLALQLANAFAGLISSSATKPLNSFNSVTLKPSPKPIFSNKYKNVRSSLSNLPTEYKDATSKSSEKYERSRLRNKKQNKSNSSRTFNKSTLEKYGWSSESNKNKQSLMSEPKKLKTTFDQPILIKTKGFKHKNEHAKSDKTNKHTLTDADVFVLKEHNNSKSHEINSSKKHKINLKESQEVGSEKDFLDEDKSSLSADNRLWFETTKARSKNRAQARNVEKQRRKRYQKLKRNMKTSIKRLTTNSARYKIRSFMNNNSREWKLNPGIPRQQIPVNRQSDPISDVTTRTTATSRTHSTRRIKVYERLIPAFANTKAKKTSVDSDYDRNLENVYEQGLSSLETYAELHNIKLNYKTAKSGNKLRQKTKSTPVEYEGFSVKTTPYNTENKNQKVKPQNKFLRYRVDSQNVTNKSTFTTAKRDLKPVNLSYSTPRPFNFDFRHKKSAAPIKFKPKNSNLKRIILSHSHTTLGIKRDFDSSKVSNNFGANNSSHVKNSNRLINLNTESTNSSRNNKLEFYPTVKENSLYLRRSANFTKPSEKVTPTIKMVDFTFGNYSNSTISPTSERKIPLLEYSRKGNENDTLKTTVVTVNKNVDFSNFIK